MTQPLSMTIEQFNEYKKTGVLPREPKTAPTVTDNIITFCILGNPVGKPRMTQRDKWKKRPGVMKYRSWADGARIAASVLPPPSTIRRLDWIAYIEPPKSWSAKKRKAALGTLHRGKPDRDNIDKAVLDALFPNDSAIALGTIEKRWGFPPRVEVQIETVTPPGEA